MKNIAKLSIVIGIALSVGACAQTKRILDEVSGVTISPAAVSVAGNTFDILEVTAASYLSFCKVNRPLSFCSKYVQIRKIIKPAILSGRAARDNLEEFFMANPGQLGPTGLYDALVASIKTLQDVSAAYNLNVPGVSK